LNTVQLYSGVFQDSDSSHIIVRMRVALRFIYTAARYTSALCHAEDIFVEAQKNVTARRVTNV
jgi:hypothetical protein